MNRRNRSQINELIKTEFTRRPPLTPTLKAIARLPVATIWTTNYDKLLETALEEQKTVIDIKSDVQHFASRVKNATLTLYKMHGDADSPERATLIRSDYEKYHINQATFLSCLAAELAQKTFLFMGFGFNDYNIEYVFGRLRAIFSDNQRQHYCVLRTPHREAHDTEPAYTARLRLHRLFVDDLMEYGVNTIEIQSYDQIVGIIDHLNEDYAVRRPKHGARVSKVAPCTVISADNIRTPGQITADPDENELMIAVLAPALGTLYTSIKRPGNPPASPMQAIGNRIEQGDPLFLMDVAQEHWELKAPVSGELVDIVVKDNSRVYDGETLCFIKRLNATQRSLYLQRSIMTGTFYLAADPKSKPFVRLGDHVRRGQSVCIIESQKSFLHVPAGATGTIKAINFENETRIEKGAYLMAIETDEAERTLDDSQLSKLPCRETALLLSPLILADFDPDGLAHRASQEVRLLRSMGIEAPMHAPRASARGRPWVHSRGKGR